MYTFRKIPTTTVSTYCKVKVEPLRNDGVIVIRDT